MDTGGFLKKVCLFIFMDNKKRLETQIELGERRELLDQETGEIIVVDQISKRIYGQKNFWKM